MKTHFRTYFLLIIFIAGIFPSASGYPVSRVPNPKVADAGNFVSNPDKILDNASVAQINAVLQSLESDTQAEIAVVVLQTIEEEGIEDFAVRLFQEWGIGKKGMDNGLLILFVLDQRAVRFETGYGLEGVLPDAICKRIQMQTMLPAFKNGDYGAGLLLGVKQIASQVRKEPVLEPQKAQSPDWSEILLEGLIVCLLLMLLSFLWMDTSVKNVKKNMKLHTNPERYFALKSKKRMVNRIMVIFLPLAGLVLVLFFLSAVYILLLLFIPVTVIPANLFALSHLRKFKKQPFACNSCGVWMHILPEKEGDVYLKPSQRLEKKIHSMDYDVFLCGQCQHTVVFRYDRRSLYTICPQCRTKVFSRTKSYIRINPTRVSSGVRRIVYTCQFCNYTENKDETIPRLQSPPPVYPPGRFGGGGSFGGGRSGGGGSTSRW